MTTATLLVPRSKPTTRFRLNNGCAGMPPETKLFGGRAARIISEECWAGRSLMRSVSEVVAPDRGKVVEDPDPEGDDGSDRKVDADLVAHEREPPCEADDGHHTSYGTAPLAAPGD